MKNFRYGLKLHCTNYESFPKAVELLDSKVFDYLELYIIPNKFDEEKLTVFKEFEIIFHAPNYNHKFNLIDHNKTFFESLETVERAIQVLKSTHTIVHPGVKIEDDKEYLDEVLESLNIVKSYGITPILENVPEMGLDGKSHLIAANFETFAEIINKSKTKLCVDFGHTIAAANYFEKEPLDYIKQFLSLNPYMTHITDGKLDSVIDQHHSIGSGEYPLEEIMKLLPVNQLISIETPKHDFVNLSSDIKDLKRLKEIERKLG